MSQENTDPKQLLQWFRTTVRPILGKTEKPDWLNQLDRLAEQIEAFEEASRELFPICILGRARIGKSTLLNTLVADAARVVPSGGGTGPLTATELRVVFGEQQAFSVTYHGRKQVSQTRFTLEAEIYRQSKAHARTSSGVGEEDREFEEAAKSDSEEDKKQKTNDAVRRAKLLITDSQIADRPFEYLADGLRMIANQKTKFQTVIEGEDLERIQVAREAVERGEQTATHIVTNTHNGDFRRALKAHASGFLAPLIRDMTIHWPSPLLRDCVELVDLPGIGLLDDVHARITSDYLRNRAKAVMLVLESGGLDESGAQALRDSGFLDRLLYSIDSPDADPVALIVVVVKIDDEAVENWHHDVDENGTALRSREQHFEDRVAACRVAVKASLGPLLHRIWETESSDAKKDVIENLVERLKIYPISALQYRMLVANDPDGPRPFLKTLEATNIPALREEIAAIAKSCLNERERRRQGTNQRFFDQLRGRLELLAAQRGDAETTHHEIEEFSRALDEFLKSFQDEFTNRKAGFRAFLRKTVPVIISGKVDAVALEANKGIRRYLRSLQDAAWQTLRAAVRREGTFYGSRQINLPKDFAQRFDTLVAEVWGREILAEVRKQTREFADYEAGAVTEVLNWARKNGTRASTRLVEALLEDVKRRRQHVNAVGKEALEDLTEKVRSELIKKIEEPIRRKCRKFVNDEQHFGRGVKSRILELFDELADYVVEAAKEPANALLAERFRGVDKEILEAFGEHTQPIDEAREALLQRRKDVLDKNDRELARLIEAALSAMPNLERTAA